MTAGLLLTMLVLFQIKHLLADFMLQSMWIVRTKGIYGHPGGLIHAGLHGGLSLPALAVPVLAQTGLGWGWALALCLAEVIVHYHVDWSKEQLNRHTESIPKDRLFWVLFGMDQCIHQLTYLAMIWACLLLS